MVHSRFLTNMFFTPSSVAPNYSGILGPNYLRQLGADLVQHSGESVLKLSSQAHHLPRSLVRLVAFFFGL